MLRVCYEMPFFLMPILRDVMLLYAASLMLPLCQDVETPAMVERRLHR